MIAFPHRFAWTAALVLCACPQAWAQYDSPRLESKGKALLGIEVELRFSVDTLDALKPEKSHVEFIVRNKTENEIQVPTAYTGGYQGSAMILWAKHHWALSLVNWAGPKAQVLKPLKADAEMTIFKGELRELFHLDLDKEKPLKANERTWYWSWIA
jgi:hypothetical protein